MFNFINISIPAFAYTFYHADGGEDQHKGGGISASGKPFYIARGEDLGKLLWQKNLVILGYGEVYFVVKLLGEAFEPYRALAASALTAVRSPVFLKREKNKSDREIRTRQIRSYAVKLRHSAVNIGVNRTFSSAECFSCFGINSRNNAVFRHRMHDRNVVFF